jgi:hypothetical protein
LGVVEVVSHYEDSDEHCKMGGTDWRGLYGRIWRRTKKCLQGASGGGGGSKKRNGTRDNGKGTCKIKQ